jgi:hypothetical protein
MVRRGLMVVLVLAGLAAGRADASTIFAENFDSENGGVANGATLNYTGFSNFTVGDGSVDLIGNGYFDFIAGNGLYVDLDGSTGNAGVQTANALPLVAGNYVLSFNLAGSHRGGNESVVINVFGDNGSYGSINPTLASTDGFTLFQIPFTLASLDNHVRFSFSNGGGDNMGALLDNVSLDTADPAPAVPEPTSLLLLGTGIAGLGVRARRRLFRS